MKKQIETQVGGEHYKKLGRYQPWEVFPRWLTPDELRGYAKGGAMAYLCRERSKNGIEDIRKAHHVLGLYLETLADDEVSGIKDTEEESAKRFEFYSGVDFAHAVYVGEVTAIERPDPLGETTLTRVTINPVFWKKHTIDNTGGRFSVLTRLPQALADIELVIYDIWTAEDIDKGDLIEVNKAHIIKKSQNP
jgi:hypothetical protein